MARLLLIHWNADEAAERAARLERAGHDVRVHADPNDDRAPRRIRDDPPEALVVDLGRLPSHGRELGAWLRRQPATRGLPLVFVDGPEEKVARVRELLPDAEYTTWPRIRGSVRRALTRRVETPVVPATFDAYSATPLPQKLGVKPGSSLALLGAPRGFRETLGELPSGVRVRARAGAASDVVLLFATSLADMRRRLPVAKRTLADRGALWICWPKKASKVATDLTQADVRRHGLGSGLVDYKIASIDATWSGLRFARRVQGRGR